MNTFAKSYEYTITLIKRRKKIFVSFLRINSMILVKNWSSSPKDAAFQSGWNWPNGSGEEDKKCDSLQSDEQTVYGQQLQAYRKVDLDFLCQRSSTCILCFIHAYNHNHDQHTRLWACLLPNIYDNVQFYLKYNHFFIKWAILEWILWRVSIQGGGDHYLKKSVHDIIF